MAEIRVYLYDRSKDGESQVVFYYLGRKIGTGVHCLQKDFKDGKVLPSDRRSKEKNIVLSSLLSQMQIEFITFFAINKREPNKEEFGKIFEKVKNGGVEKNERRLTDCINEYIALKTRKNTIELYKQTINKVETFDKKCLIESISKKWLMAFEKKMTEDGMSVNTRSIHLRNIRSVINYCIDEGYTNNYPFRGFSIKKEETRKRCLTIEELLTIKNYPLEECKEKYRDVFMLMFYLIGINTIDLLSLDLKDYKNGYIEYHRAKTNRLYRIKVEPEAAAIINKYKGTKKLLCFGDSNKNYLSFAHKMTEELQKIGKIKKVSRKKEYESLFPELSPYWARHTWATIAASIDIPVETIGQALGHASSDVTHVYIKFDNSKVDKANRQVLDFVKGYEEIMNL